MSRRNPKVCSTPIAVARLGLGVVDAPSTRYPRLDPRTARDDAALNDVIDAFLGVDAEARGGTKAVMRLQGHLRRRINDTAWQVYLKLEEATNARNAQTNIAVARWAFGEGRRKRP